jgi:hypothetical protein
MTYETCDWYKTMKFKSPLDDFIKERSASMPDIFCDNDRQIMSVDYVQCVKLDEIEKVEPWAPSREDAIRKWATPDKLRRLRYYQEEESGKRVIPPDAFHDMPRLSREYNLKSKDQEKFKIGDGIHRINRSRELGIDCILASVGEHVKVSKNDIENIETKQENRQ